MWFPRGHASEHGANESLIRFLSGPFSRLDRFGRAERYGDKGIIFHILLFLHSQAPTPRRWLLLCRDHAPDSRPDRVEADKTRPADIGPEDGRVDGATHAALLRDSARIDEPHLEGAPGTKTINCALRVDENDASTLNACLDCGRLDRERGRG